MRPDPQNPTDDPPSAIEDGLAVERDGQFQATADGAIRCLTCRTEFPAASQHTHDAARLEGTSDPDDMLLVLPVQCPTCGATGSLQLGYGPLASLEDSEVLRHLETGPAHGSTASS
jgi:hypothetical protein